MTRREFRGYTAERDAAKHLTAKYGSDVHHKNDVTMTDRDAVFETAMGALVTRGADYISRPAADGDDCLAALHLVEAARRALDHDELIVMIGAREAGQTWQQIGVALGHTEATAARAARARYSQLRGRFPGVDPAAATGP